jgi:hypothetical protein
MKTFIVAANAGNFICISYTSSNHVPLAHAKFVADGFQDFHFRGFFLDGVTNLLLNCNNPVAMAGVAFFFCNGVKCNMYVAKWNFIFKNATGWFLLNGWVTERMVTASKNGMVREGKNNGIGHQPRNRKKKLLSA